MDEKNSPAAVPPLEVDPAVEAYKDLRPEVIAQKQERARLLALLLLDFLRLRN